MISPPAMRPMHQQHRKVSRMLMFDPINESPFALAPLYHPNITVVNSGPVAGGGAAGVGSSASVAEDGDLNKLAAIPKFLPILRSSINLQNDPTQLPHMENTAVGVTELLQAASTNRVSHFSCYNCPHACRLICVSARKQCRANKRN